MSFSPCSTSSGARSSRRYVDRAKPLRIRRGHSPDRPAATSRIPAARSRCCNMVYQSMMPYSSTAAAQSRALADGHQRHEAAVGAAGDADLLRVDIAGRLHELAPRRPRPADLRRPGPDSWLLEVRAVAGRSAHVGRDHRCSRAKPARWRGARSCRRPGRSGRRAAARQAGFVPSRFRLNGIRETRR